MGEEEDGLKAILRDAFGDSSSESDGESSCNRRRRVQVKDSSVEDGLKAILRDAFGDSSSESDGESSCDRRRRVQVNDSSDEDGLKAILRDAFGDSSSESDGESSCDRRRRIQVNDSSDEVVRSIFGDTRIWEPITEINGLWICRDFLSADKQSSLLSALEKEGYLTEASHNQAMRFGDLPPWALELSYIIRENVLFSSHFSESTELMSGGNSKEPRLFPPELLWREPLFNQFILNRYQPGEGIRAHVDLMRFEDGIAIISLESSCIMHFSSVEAEGDDHLVETKKVNTASAKIPVLLTPGSLIVMWGEARYQWKHEINRKPGYQIWQGKEIEQKRRTSVTLRRLCQTE